MKLGLINKFDVKSYLQKQGAKPMISILAVGILILVLSSGGNANKNANVQKNILEKNTNKNINSQKSNLNYEYCHNIENNLKKIITRVNGVEDVTVMITLKSSKEEVVLKDTPYDKEDTTDEKLYSENEETVIMEDEEGNTYPYVVKEINPEVEGVVVGLKTSKENVGKDVMEIVQVLFDIPVHKIKIVNIN